MKKILIILFLQFSIVFAANQATRKIFLVGDSTVTNYKASAYPMAGWGQVLQKFINSANFTVDNRAIGGRSSRSFIEEGRWNTVKNDLSVGDFVMIQFGHNDRDTKPERYSSPTDYKKYIAQYVNESRAKGAIPILVTPMVMNAWRNGVLRNVFTENGAEYVQKMKEVATELKVPLIDLNQKSWDFVSSVGVDYATRFIFNTYPAGEYPNYPNGSNDGTHFQEMGALQLAKFVTDGIKELRANTEVKALSDALLPQYQVTFTSNVVAAGVITKSATYPAGVTLTLKALTNSGHTFLSWKDASNTVLSTKSLYYSVTMRNSATQFKAIFDNDVNVPTDDCAGVAGGKAALDNCGVCTGGSTGKTACTNSIEAETACEVDGVKVEATNTGFYGAGYVNTDNIIGSKAVWNFNSELSQTVTTSIRFTNGGTTNRNMTLKVNGVTLSEIVFVATGSFTTWKTVEVSLPLIQGGNKIELVSLTSDGGPNIDLFAFQTSTVISGGCTVDCAGLLGGTARIDDCNVCSGGATGLVPNASCVDCNGIINGNAVVDNCQICTGGTTGVQACTNELQAEDVCVIDGLLLETLNTGFLGEGYANTDNAMGVQLSFKLNSTTSKNVKFYVRYANGGTTNRDALISVNGTLLATLLLPSTDSWTTWKTAIVNINLQAGINEIILEANTTDGLANIDVFTWSDASVSLANCMITGGVEDVDYSAIKGYPNPFTSSIALTVPVESSYQVFNSKGANVLSGTCHGSCEIGKTLEAGTYELVIISDGKKSIQKIIKQE